MSVAYIRPMGNLEGFFKVLSDSFEPEHWTISLALKLNFPPSITDPTLYLKRAWKALRAQYPALGGSLDTISGQIRVTFDFDSWVTESFRCYDDEDSNTFFSKTRSATTATCNWLPASSEVVLRSSHWRIDGVGMVRLGHAFLEALATALRVTSQEAFDAYVTQPISDPPIGPSLEELAQRQSRIRTSEDGRRLAAGADRLVGEFIRGIPSIGLPTRTGSITSEPGNSLRAARTIDSVTTSKIIAACRANGIKVTSAAHAAVVRVTASYPQHPLAKSYTAFAPVDLRHAITTLVGPESKNDSRVTGLYFSGLPVCIDGVLGTDGGPAKDFRAIAHELQSVYSRDLVQFWDPEDGSGQMVSLLDLAEPYVERTTNLLKAPVPEGLPPVQTPDMSSLGILETYFQNDYVAKDDLKVEVVDIWLATDMSTRNLQFHVWSWKGELTLAACFNSSFYEQDFVVEVLDKVIDALLVGCGINKV
ncbi:hypothetical protein M426DRAFT_27262 [Hypoxylon sp. CI-4A]|nr:hypothetical protein M426DRAFT_27262 [Hypoxylon sp. CI-4A]